MAAGVLLFDANPTTARLTRAGLQLSGFEVFQAEGPNDAVALCERHGPSGEGQIAAIVLDASADAAGAASLLRALISVPGAATLPGILLVDRANPEPFPGSEALASLRRPFTTPALARLVRETLAEHGHGIGGATEQLGGDRGRAPLRAVLEQVAEQHGVSDEALDAVVSAVAALAAESPPETASAFRARLGPTRVEDLLQLIDDTGDTGVVAVEHGGASVRIHVDRRRVLLAEARGTTTDFKLGRFVVEEGYMSAAELDAFASQRDPQGRPLGARLVDREVLSQAALARVLARQAREIVCEVLTWREGALTFVPVDALDPLAALASRQAGGELWVSEVLLEGLRRVEEALAMGAHMPAPDDVYLRVDSAIAQVGRASLSSEELAVLEALSGRVTVMEIARKQRTGALSVARVLYRLSRSGLARRRVVPVAV